MALRDLYGPHGEKVYYWGAWGYPTPAAPFITSDGRLAKPCEHTHVTWSSWFQYGYYSGGVYYSGWTRGAGGGLSGVQVNDYTCTMSTKNVWNNNGAYENGMGWGVSSGSITFQKTGNPFILMVVGASALSHGMQGCDMHGCINNPWIDAFAMSW